MDLGVLSGELFSRTVNEWDIIVGLPAVLLMVLPLIVDATAGAVLGLCGFGLRWIGQRLAGLSRLEGSPRLVCAAGYLPWLLVILPLAVYLAARPSLLRQHGGAVYLLALPLAALLIAATVLGLRLAERWVTFCRHSGGETPPTKPGARLWRWIGALVLFALGALLFWVDWSVYRNNYFPLHCVLALVYLALFSLASLGVWREQSRLRPRPGPRRVVPIVLGLALVVMVGSEVLLGQMLTVRFFSLHFTVLESKALLLSRAPLRWSRSLIESPRTTQASRTIQATVKDPLPAAGEVLALRQRIGLPQSIRPPNVFFITFDSLRASSLALYGYPVSATPLMDELAKKSVLFRAAYAPEPNTQATMASWAAARRVSPGQTGLQPRLYQALRAGGYTLFCIIPWRYVSGPLGNGDPGCHHYQRLTALNWVDAAVDEFIKGERRQRPLFFQVHLMETHRPYPPAPDSRFGKGMHADFLATLQRTEAVVGTWLERFRAKGMLDNAVVIISSDHGESFGERGTHGHQSLLYDEQTRVPLLIWSPKGRRVSHQAPVSTAWIGQTILALTGVVPARELPGPFIFSAEPVYISQGQLHGVVQGRHKLIYDRRSDSLELYDLSTDPRERRNLVDSRRDRLKKMLGTLRRVSGIVVE